MKKTTQELEREVVTLQEELQRQREKTSQMEKALAKLGVKVRETGQIEGQPLSQTGLWTSIRHEILTPMDAILGMTDLVLETDLEEEQRNYLEMINASADRLFGVVGDILDYSELVENKLRQDMVNFDLPDTITYDLYIAELSAKHKELDFSYNISEDIPTYLHSDPERFRQVLGNLISNGIKYTEKGSVVVAIKPAGYDPKGRLLLKVSVADTGIGLSPDKVKNVFTQPATTGIEDVGEKLSEGGLGLIVSAKLVKLFGGEIGVDSKEGKGSTFWYTWPVSNPIDMFMGELPPDMISEERDRSQVLLGGEVLLAEDEFINASITKAFLEQNGLEVTVASNGLEAVEAFCSKDFQAVLMDVQMPKMDGIEATKLIRKKERGKGSPCPIIALTAHGMHGDREKCLQAGMDDYLPKPLDRMQLVDMLAYYMTRKALLVGSDPVGQHEIMQLLVEKGWSVIIAETGRLAMYEASLSYFDLIIIDSSTSHQETVETVQTIRKLEEFSGCRATILHVCLEEGDNGDRYDQVDIDEFLARPNMEKKILSQMAAVG